MIERRKPSAFVFGDPASECFLERHGVEKMQFLAPLAMNSNQVRFFENPEMLHHSLPAHEQVLTERVQVLAVLLAQGVQ